MIAYVLGGFISEGYNIFQLTVDLVKTEAKTIIIICYCVYFRKLYIHIYLDAYLLVSKTFLIVVNKFEYLTAVKLLVLTFNMLFNGRSRLIFHIFTRK